MPEVHAHTIRGIRLRLRIQLEFDWLASKYWRELTTRELRTRKLLPGMSVFLSLSFLSLQWRWPPPVGPLPLAVPLLQFTRSMYVLSVDT